MARGLAVTAILVITSGCGGGGGSTAGQCIDSPFLAFLRQQMDRFHDRFPVYDDVSSAGNHFHAFGKAPDQNAAVSVNGSWTLNPHTGATAIRCVFTDAAGPNFGGMYFLNGVLPPGETKPQVNFGTAPDAGIDLAGAVRLTFWARGEQGGEEIEFFMGGVGRDPGTGAPQETYPDSTPRVPSQGTVFVLTTDWRQFSISLVGRDLGYVLGGFAWIADDAHNPGGAVFYLDDIQYELSGSARDRRLGEPRFLASFLTLPVQPDPFDANTDDDIDFVQRNTAFAYDNAVALLAFLASGCEDDLARARLIGDAFVYAAANDRTFDDGRIRSAYAAGDIALPPGWTPNGRAGTVPIPGFYDEASQEFIEILQEASDVGNNAWPMIALVALHRRTGEPAYLEPARRIGEFIRTCRNDVGTFRGFQGGIDGPETVTPIRRAWGSVEHNLDVFAAFRAMAEVTGDGSWMADALHAEAFVEAMWDTGRGCILAGTLDPENRNEVPGQLPCDVQSWTSLAIPGSLALHPGLLECAELHHRTTDAGFSGFDFNEDLDGVWFEGTAHMAIAYAHAGDLARAAALVAELQRARNTPPYGDGAGIAASSRDGLTTGFGSKFFRRLHIAATAWSYMAEVGFNPFDQSSP
jgi:hypothetical protein